MLTRLSSKGQHRFIGDKIRFYRVRFIKQLIRNPKVSVNFEADSRQYFLRGIKKSWKQ